MVKKIVKAKSPAKSVSQSKNRTKIPQDPKRRLTAEGWKRKLSNQRHSAPES